MTTTNSNMSLSSPARRFTITVPIPQPIDGLEVPIVLVSEFEFTILRVFRRTQDGDCDITLYNNSQIVELDDAQGDGSIVADEGAADEALPDGSATSNYTVAEGNRLHLVVDNSSTSVVGLEVQIDCEKTSDELNDDD